MSGTVLLILHTLGHALAERIRRVWKKAWRREKKLRIGIDIRPFYEPLTGIGWYLYHLLHEIAKDENVELYLFGDARITEHGPSLHAAVPANAQLCAFDLRDHASSRWSRPMTAAAYVLWMKLIDVDVMFGANYFLPRLPAAIARRRVVTVHDLTYKRYPDLLQKETLDNLDAIMPREIATADAVVCVSEATRQDLLRYYQIEPRRATTVLSGIADAVPAEPGMDLPARYILFVSTVEPRKNLTVLLDAFERLRADGSYTGELVVVGRIGWRSEAVVPRLSAPGVRHLNYVSPGQLASIYQRAELFVFPSLFEGFGFPILEAMLHGVPTIAAHSSSLPEVGGDATLYFEPADSQELERQLRRVLADPRLREDLVRRGREQAARFSWERAGRETLAVLRRVAE